MFRLRLGGVGALTSLCLRRERPRLCCHHWRDHRASARIMHRNDRQTCHCHANSHHAIV